MFEHKFDEWHVKVRILRTEKTIGQYRVDCQNEVKSTFLLAYATTIARSRNYLY